MSLEVTHLEFAYGETPVLRDIGFIAPTGKLTVVLGRNGCGKSTLFKILAGLLPVRQGVVKVMEQDTRRLSGSARASLLGYLPQFHQAVFPFTVQDVVLTGRAAFVVSVPGSKDREIAAQAIEDMGITHLALRPYTELSGGERQLVMVARILAQQPKVILLDEPISHLDLGNQQRLLNTLRRIAESGVTILAVLHDPNAAMLYGDEVLFLKDGRLHRPQDGGSPWRQSFIEDLYGITATVFPYQGKAFVLPVPSLVPGSPDV